MTVVANDRSASDVESTVDDNRKVVLITGCNGGVGYALIERLLAKDHECYTIIMACRSFPKAKSARSKLLQKYPSASLEIRLIDLADLSSVYQFANRIKREYERVDLLYCNAGIMPIKSFNWSRGIIAMFKDPVGLFTQGEGVLMQSIGEKTQDGIGKVFQANVFSHYILIEELAPLFDGTSRIVWTGSTCSGGNALQADDIQHVAGAKPYHSSKEAMDYLSCAMNTVADEKHDECPKNYVASPGTAATDILKNWVVSMISFMMMILFRPFIPSLTGSAHNASISLFELSDRSGISPFRKYHAEVTAIGHPYTKEYDLVRSKNFELNVLQECKRLKRAMDLKYK